MWRRIIYRIFTSVFVEPAGTNFNPEDGGSFSETLAPVRQTKRRYTHEIRNFISGSLLFISRPQSCKEEN
jgi:hypothetical protein